MVKVVVMDSAGKDIEGESLVRDLESKVLDVFRERVPGEKFDVKYVHKGTKPYGDQSSIFSQDERGDKIREASDVDNLFTEAEEATEKPEKKVVILNVDCDKQFFTRRDIEKMGNAGYQIVILISVDLKDASTDFLEHIKLLAEQSEALFFINEESKNKYQGSIPKKTQRKKEQNSTLGLTTPRIEVIRRSGNFDVKASPPEERYFILERGVFVDRSNEDSSATRIKTARKNSNAYDFFNPSLLGAADIAKNRKQVREQVLSLDWAVFPGSYEGGIFDESVYYWTDEGNKKFKVLREDKEYKESFKTAVKAYFLLCGYNLETGEESKLYFDREREKMFIPSQSRERAGSRASEAPSEISVAESVIEDQSPYYNRYPEKFFHVLEAILGMTEGGEHLVFADEKLSKENHLKELKNFFKNILDFANNTRQTGETPHQRQLYEHLKQICDVLEIATNHGQAKTSLKGINDSVKESRRRAEEAERQAEARRQEEEARQAAEEAGKKAEEAARKAAEEERQEQERERERERNTIKNDNYVLEKTGAEGRPNTVVEISIVCSVVGGHFKLNSVSEGEYRLVKSAYNLDDVSRLREEISDIMIGIILNLCHVNKIGYDEFEGIFNTVRKKGGATHKIDARGKTTKDKDLLAADLSKKLSADFQEYCVRCGIFDGLLLQGGLKSSDIFGLRLCNLPNEVLTQLTSKKDELFEGGKVNPKSVLPYTSKVIEKMELVKGLMIDVENLSGEGGNSKYRVSKPSGASL